MAAFATSDEVATRLGRDLTDTEEDQVDLLLELAAGLIADELNRDDAWADALDPIPSQLRTVSIESVVRVLNNPSGARQFSETIGVHSRSRSFDAGRVGLTLTDLEGRLVRRGVYGEGTGSSRVESIVDDHLDFADDGRINDSVGS